MIQIALKHIVENGEIAQMSNFTFSTMFSLSFFLQCVKMRTYGGQELTAKQQNFRLVKIEWIWLQQNKCDLKHKISSGKGRKH